MIQRLLSRLLRRFLPRNVVARPLRAPDHHVPHPVRLQHPPGRAIEPVAAPAAEAAPPRAPTPILVPSLAPSPAPVQDSGTAAQSRDSRPPRPRSPRGPRPEGGESRQRQRYDGAPDAGPGRPAPTGPRPPRPPRSAPARAPEPPAAPWDPASYEVPEAPGKTRFKDLALPEPLIHAIADLGFQYATAIQALALPEALAGKDVAGRAQTGTGKTAAFLLTIFRRFLEVPTPADRQPGMPRALILAPTRELVAQIDKDARDLGKYCPCKTVAVYGGLGYGEQMRALETGTVDVVAATPGRLLDFLRKRVLRFDAIEILIIDEADRMLDMGFIPDVRRIIAHLPTKGRRQTMLFSATLSPDIMRLAAAWMSSPVVVHAEAEQIAAANVEQIVYLVTSQGKAPLLTHLLRDPAFTRVLVFTNRKDAGQRLADRLERLPGLSIGLLSGDVPQTKRMRILEDFRGGRIRVLVATDVAGRGLHIEHVSHVINYDVPLEPEDYIHRIGRTGRAGQMGIALTFACERESFTLPEIEELLGHPLEYRHPPEDLLRRSHAAPAAALAPVTPPAAPAPTPAPVTPPAVGADATP